MKVLSEVEAADYFADLFMEMYPELYRATIDKEKEKKLISGREPLIYADELIDILVTYYKKIYWELVDEMEARAKLEGFKF